MDSQEIIQLFQGAHIPFHCLTLLTNKDIFLLKSTPRYGLILAVLRIAFSSYTNNAIIIKVYTIVINIAQYRANEYFYKLLCSLSIYELCSKNIKLSPQFHVDTSTVTYQRVYKIKIIEKGKNLNIYLFSYSRCCKNPSRNS